MQLTHRHWQITDANGRCEEVQGPGVVGEQPKLKPGDAFSYTSGCPLQTPSGIMVGTYRMIDESGEVFRRRDTGVLARQSLCEARLELTRRLERACVQFIAFSISGRTTLAKVAALIGPTSLKAIVPSPLTMKVSGTP